VPGAASQPAWGGGANGRRPAAGLETVRRPAATSHAAFSCASTQADETLAESVSVRLRFSAGRDACRRCRTRWRHRVRPPKASRPPGYVAVQGLRATRHVAECGPPLVVPCPPHLFALRLVHPRTSGSSAPSMSLTPPLPAPSGPVARVNRGLGATLALYVCPSCPIRPPSPAVAVVLQLSPSARPSPRP